MEIFGGFVCNQIDFDILQEFSIQFDILEISKFRLVWHKDVGKKSTKRFTIEKGIRVNLKNIMGGLIPKLSHTINKA